MNQIRSLKKSYTTVIYADPFVSHLSSPCSHATARNVCLQSRNEWHHVAVVWTGRDVNMYMDGERKDSSPLTGE